MTIQPNMTVTVERGAFYNDHHVGKRATVVAVVHNILAVIQIDGMDDTRGAFIDCLQPVMTAAMFTNQLEAATA